MSGGHTLRGTVFVRMASDPTLEIAFSVQGSWRGTGSGSATPGRPTRAEPSASASQVRTADPSLMGCDGRQFAAFESGPKSESQWYAVDVSVVDVIQDLNALRDLAEREDDPERRRALRSVRSRVADRDRGAKVAEAADVLSVSPTTVRAWIKTGVLQSVPRSSPIRVEVLNLADVKRVVDLLRAHGQDRDLLSAIYRRLRDHDLLETDEFAEGFEDLRAGRVMPIGDDLRKETAELDRAE